MAYVNEAYGPYGFIDKTGNIVIPYKWVEVENFHDGFAMVKGTPMESMTL